jgi:hypothetical protein
MISSGSVRVGAFPVKCIKAFQHVHLRWLWVTLRTFTEQAKVNIIRSSGYTIHYIESITGCGNYTGFFQAEYFLVFHL